MLAKLRSMLLRRAATIVAGTVGAALIAAAAPAGAVIPAAGYLTDSFPSGGLTRSFTLYVPPTYDGTRAVPLVVALHGNMGTGAEMSELTLRKFDQLGSVNDALVVYPDGIARSWNDGRGVTAAADLNVDDVGFLSDLIDHLAATLAVDITRIYGTGLSNGAIMLHRLACDRPGKLRGIAPVAGTMPEAILPACAPSAAVPVVLFHGTQDELAPYGGGPTRSDGSGRIVSAQADARFWAERNGCNLTPTSTDLPVVVADGTSVQQLRYSQCRDGADVVLYVIEGGGHTWPGGQQFLPEFAIGRTTHNVDAAGVIWSTFGLTSLQAAVLPGSRSIEVGATATVFATIVNPSPATATGCRVSPLTGIPASFLYQTTDPATNVVTGTANTPAVIPPGGRQTFVLALTPTDAVASTEVRLGFECDKTSLAPIVSGVNTLPFSASRTPGPDVVALAATQGNDGIVVIPGVGQFGAFAVATINLGTAATLTVSADTGSAALPVGLLVCPTDAATGACLSEPAPSAVRSAGTADTATFAVFARGDGVVIFEPVRHRVFVRLRDGAGALVGSTSVAVMTE